MRHFWFFLTCCIHLYAHTQGTARYEQQIQRLVQSGEKQKAQAICLELLENYPEFIFAHCTLARLYKEQEQLELAGDHFLQAIALEPQNWMHRFELSLVYILQGRTHEAIALYDQIIQQQPNNITAIYNRGYAYKMQGDAAKATTCYQHALRVDPHYDPAHFALGMAYLMRGDFYNGWHQHKRFLKKVGRNAPHLRTWLAHGKTAGKRILLRPEGGLGDTIHFIRYARELKAYGMYVTVVVQKPLYELLKRCDYIDQLLPIGSQTPVYDDHTTLMSIPAIMYHHELSLPTYRPYITPDPDRVAYWKQKLQHDKKFKIGIVWESNVYNDSSRPPVARRGMPLELLARIAEIEGVSLYSLQQHDGVEQLQYVLPHRAITTFDEHFDKTYGSFVDTAAVMMHMDLIISVDTAIPHLAGALGRPVWLLLPWATDWRWIEKRSDSPWYPTMTIFKQPEPFDWHSVVATVMHKLQSLLEDARS